MLRALIALILLSFGNTAVAQQLYGPGSPITAGSNTFTGTQTAPNFVSTGNIFANLSATQAPSSICSTSSFNCDLKKQPLALGLTINGASTLGIPTAGQYLIVPNLSLLFGQFTNNSGSNPDTGDNNARTGAEAINLTVLQNGFGDAAGLFVNAFASNSQSSCTYFLCEPAVSLFNGQAVAGVSNVLLTGLADIKLSDTSGVTNYSVSAIGENINLIRNNAVQSKGGGWMGYRLQNQGTVAIDAGISLAGASGTGGFGIGLDLADATYGTNQAGVTLQADQRIYMSAAPGLNAYPWNQTLGSVYFSYSSAQSAFVFTSPVDIGVSSANFWKFAGAATSNDLTAVAMGSDTNVSADFIAKGIGGFNFEDNGSTVLVQITSGNLNLGSGIAFKMNGTTVVDASRNLTVASITEASATLITTTTSFTNNAASQSATMTNSPTAGNPTKWIPINDNGTTRNIPAW